MIPTRYRDRTVRTVKDRLDKAGILVPSVRRLLQARRFGDAARSLWFYSLHARLDKPASVEMQRSVRVLRKLEQDRPLDPRYRTSTFVPNMSVIQADVAASRFPPKRATERATERTPKRTPKRATERTSKRGTGSAPKRGTEPTPKRATERTPKRETAVAPQVYEAIKRYEGLPRDRDPGLVYRNVHGLPTVGYGHLVTARSPGIFKNLFGSSFDVDKVVRGEKALTRNQIDRLFRHDMDTRIDQVRRALPDFDRWPAYLQQEVMSAKYRGDLGPKTTDHLRRGEWKKAAQEVKRVADYRVRGIKPRIDRVSDAILRYAANKNAQNAPTPTPKPEKSTPPEPEPSPKATPRIRRMARGAGRAVQAAGRKILADVRRAQAEFDAQVKRVESNERLARLRIAARKGSEKARNELRKHEIRSNALRREAQKKITEAKNEAQKRLRAVQKDAARVAENVQTRAKPHIDRIRADAERRVDELRPKIEKAKEDLARRAKDAKAAANRAARRAATTAMRRFNRGAGARRLERPRRKR